MIVSRGLVLSRAIVKALPKTLSNGSPSQLQQIRNMSGHWTYRTGVTSHSKATIWCTELLGGFMWWWILWHFWHDFDHIIGEFPYPDPSKWTDAELGIPREE